MNYSRKILSCTMVLDAEPEQVFPLLCPIREYEWIEHWKCEMIYSESGYAEQDCIFKTSFPDEGEDVWVTSKYVPSKLIEFIRVNGVRTIRYQITLQQLEKGKTKSEWTQIITALNKQGNEFIDSLSEEEFVSEKKILEKLLNHYLKTGKMLKHEG